MIGKRLKLARAAAGLSLRDLAAKIENRVSAQQIGKYERDEDVPGSGVLIALSRALSVSVDYLVGDQEMVLDGVEFRKKQITSKKEEAQIEAQALHLIERYLLVEEILGLQSAEWDKPRQAPFPVREIGDAELAAKLLREHWNLGIDPIQDLVELLEERGIKVVVVKSHENIDGLAAQVRRSQGEPIPVIVIRSGAHGFAGAFLMPAEALWSNVGRNRSSIGWSELFALKKLFGASVQAITYRCADLGIFPSSLKDGLFREYSRLGFRTGPNYEPHQLPEEKPERFDRLCYRALAESAISEAKAAELLNITVHELNRRMEEPAAVAM
jgi:transcriptional regulator with XRE-family HTH domain